MMIKQTDNLTNLTDLTDKEYDDYVRSMNTKNMGLQS